MPEVIIVRPNITKEEETKALERVADVLTKMTKEEYGITVKYKLEFTRNDDAKYIELASVNEA